MCLRRERQGVVGVEVIQRSVALAEPGRRPDGPLNVPHRPLDGLRYLEALGEVRRDSSCLATTRREVSIYSILFIVA